MVKIKKKNGLCLVSITLQKKKEEERNINVFD